MSEVSRQIEAQRRPWRRLLADARALAAPIVSYWGMLLLSSGLFTVLLGIGGDLDSEKDLWIIGCLLSATVVGVLFGQICALARVRSWVVLAIGLATLTALFLVLMGLEGHEEQLERRGLSMLFEFLSAFFFLFPLFAVSGLLSLRTSVFAVFALFAPLAWFTSSILYISQELTGTVARWFAGDKWAIWDVATAPVLLLGVGLSLLYLTGRERHRIYRWMTGPEAAEGALVRRVRGSAAGATATGCGTIVAVALLAVILSVGTGLLAPYLWRSEPAPEGEPDERGSHAPSEGPDRDGDGVSDEQEARDGTDPDSPDSDGDGLQDGQEKKMGSDPQLPDTDGDGLRDGDEPANGTSPTSADTDGDGTGDAEDPGGPLGTGPGGERIVEAARDAGLSLFFLLLLVLLVLLGLLVFGPPLRRSMLLQALRSPPLPTGPSLRVESAWRLCEIALGDLGVSPVPGDTPQSLVDKAIAQLPRGTNSESLREIAEIAVRARYGLGLDPADEERAVRQAEMAYQAIWEALSEWDKVRAIYRWGL